MRKREMKVPCPLCDKPKSQLAAMCRACRDRTPYTRTPALRAKMSESRKGVPKPPGYVPASKRPEVAAKIAAYWTPERRAEKSKAVSHPRNPYLGLHWRKRKAIAEEVGQCQRCGNNGPEVRLGIHHKDRNKRNHARDNLEVLCGSCHASEHTHSGESGWSRYHATH